MKNKSNAKKPVHNTTFQKITFRLKNRLQLKHHLRQSVCALLITAILTGALFVDWDWLKTWAQSGCGGPDQIFQGCALGGGQVETDLTNQAVNDVITMYRLSADRTVVMRSLRNEVRAMLYVRLLALIKKPNKTAAENQALATFADKIKDSRVRAAIAARDEYHRWQQNPCGGYQPPAPYTYKSPGCTFYTIILNGAPYAPTFEEFQQYGVAAVHGAEFTNDAKIVSEKTGLAVRNAAGFGVTAAATTLGVLIGQTLTFSALNSVLPFAASTWGTWVQNVGQVGVVARAWGANLVKIPQAASASSGTAGGVGLGGPIAVISTAIQILVTQTINVVNQNNLPGKLDQAIVDMQNSNVNVSDLLTTDAGNSEIYMNFIFQTLPDYAALEAPAPQPTDRAFVVYDPATSQISETQVLNARLEWENNRYLQLRLTGGLFAYPEQTGAPTESNPSRQQIAIRYLDWDNKIQMAYRTGLSFYVVDPTNPQQTGLTDILKLKVDNRNVVVKIKQTQMQAFEVGTKPISCGVIVNGGQGTDTVLGKVTDAGEPASSLNATINGAATATVSGVKISNLRVDDNYQVIGKVESINAPTPTTAAFTATVANGIGQQKSFPVEIKKTSVDNTLPKETLGRMTLGGYFETRVKFGLEITCSGSQVTSSGDLPPGLKIARREGDFSGDTFLFGTPTSAGKYSFTLTKQYDNGESVSQDYVVVVNTDLIKLDDSATSWWRAESGVDDHFKRANGTVVGNIGFDTGKVNRGFKFDGSNSYIRLPENTFSPGNNFTFETWFKTDRAGVILGSQPVADPYGNANGATPLVYVTNDGKLQVQMFRDQYNRSIKTERSVNDNQYHHVAVTYSASDQMRRVYLDGEAVGAVFGGQLASSTKYQFGTGYATDAPNGGTNGWLNFNGVIDEPTVYNRALAQEDIRKIYAVGGYGKLYLKIRPYAPQVRDGSNGGLLMDAQSSSALTYKLRWQTPGNPMPQTLEQDTSNFLDLRAANYTVTIEDDYGNKYETSASVPNAPANIEVSSVVEQPQCAYETSGSIKILVNGGYSIPYGSNLKYSILGGVVQQDSNVFTNLGARTYFPRVHDLSTGTVYDGQQVTMTAGPAPFALSPGAFPNAQQNQPYSQTFTLSGNTAPYTFRAAGLDVNTNYELPAGLTATVAPNSITFSGTPTVAGTFPIRILYNDQRNCADSKTINLTVVALSSVAISGRVTNGGQGVPNAAITLSGGANRTTTTDASGNYTFVNLSPNQTYTTAASLPGYTLASSSRTYSNLAANVTDADFQTAFTHYEGDIAPRTAGDGKVDVRDYVMINRIFNNQEPPPAAGGEWQRASVSPRSSLGSTRILSSDAPQILRYIVRNDPLTLVGGPSVPASNNFAGKISALNAGKPPADSSNANSTNQSLTPGAAATVTAATVSAANGTVSVPITMTSDGTAAAAQFTVAYDSSKLTLQSVGSGGDSNNLFAVNTAAPGKVTVAAYRFGDSNFPVNAALMKLNFTVVQGAVGNAAVGFTDAPTERIAADQQANAITLNTQNGNVVISNVYRISGKITNGGQGLANVSVYRGSGASQISTVTDAAGNYSFDDVPPNSSQTINAALNGYSFSPAPRSYTMTGNVTDADFATQNVTYEGDIAARPNGDGAINVLDLISLGRIVGNLDVQPANGGEFQRTDVAPLATFGDGALNVQDLVQLGRYAGSLDRRTPATGAASPIAANRQDSETSFGRMLSSATSVENLLSQNFTGSRQRGKTPNEPVAPVGTATLGANSVQATSTNAVVPINLNSMGDVAAIQFTVNYDPAKLSIPADANNSAIINRYQDTTFIINNNTPGRLGIVAYQPLNGAAAFPNGTVKLFDINFTVAGGVNGTTAVSFGSDPVPQIASNPQAGAVPVANSPGTVTLMGTTAAGVSISGRVLIGNLGLRNATVLLTDQNGEIRTARTTSFGSYSFENVPGGRTYVATVVSKRFEFQPQVISAAEDISDLNFIADPQ